MSSPIFLETRGPLSVCLLFPTFDREGYEKCFASAFYLYVCMRARARASVSMKKTFANAPDVHLQILGLRARQKGRQGTDLI